MRANASLFFIIGLMIPIVFGILFSIYSFKTNNVKIITNIGSDITRNMICLK
ncbi:MAG: hypothetical protein U9N59_16745 [Campylobacterota bacterium]|nr:hypothetical protein [Campylobacterota bacterium]